MTDLLTSPITEVATFDLTYEGLIAAHAEPDEGGYDDDRDYQAGETWRTRTLRINGADVIQALDAATEDLREPRRATVTIDGKQVASGRIYVHAGEYETPWCGEPGCCGGEWPSSIKVGNTDVLAMLEDLHGTVHEVRFAGQGYVPPLVDVTFAHHTPNVGPDKVYAKPLDRMQLPLDYLRGLKYRVTAPSRDRIEEAERALAAAYRG